MCENALVCLLAIKVVKLTNAIAWVLKREIIRAGRTTFGTGISIPSVVLLPTSRSWASAALSCGGRRGKGKA
jgi:hypothetical protein